MSNSVLLGLYSPLTRLFVETRTLSTALKSTDPINNIVTAQEATFLLASFAIFATVFLLAGMAL